MMNFSHYNISRLQREARSLPAKIRSLVTVFLLRVGVVLVAMSVIIGSYSLYGGYLGIISKAPDIEGVFDSNKDYEKYSTFIYYGNGEKMDRELSSAGANRVKADINTIDKKVRDCFVAMEDERFYEHNGIDVRGIFRAAYSVLEERSLDYGASTITQQLLKNQVFGGGAERSALDKILRKVQEQYLAVQLEYRLDKATILEYYLNTINFGNGAYGIEKAAEVYFGKTASELTISEAAVLAPIAWSPTLANPLRDQEKNSRRRKDCLKNLFENGFCDEDEYLKALADSEDVYRRIQEHNQIKLETTSAYNSYFVDELINQVLNDLKAAGYSSTEASDLLYSGGLQIYSTQDKTIQTIMDAAFTDEANFPAIGKGSYYQLSDRYALSLVSKSNNNTAQHYHLNDFLEYFRTFNDSNKLYYHEKGRGSLGISAYTINKDDLEDKLDRFVEAMKEEFRTAHPGEEFSVQESREITLQPQCAMVIMDPHTGEVLAQYGGRGEKVGNRVLNRASGTYRQAGSTFKVLASFMPAIDACGCTLATVFDDVYYTYPGSSKQVINWYDQGKGKENYRGLQPIRLGICNSLNVVAVRCLVEKVTPAVAVDYLVRLGFKNIVTDKKAAKNDYNASIALGGLTKGCSVLEMTAAYAAIANEGVYIEPRYYSYVLDHDGNILLNNDIDHATKRQALKNTTAWLITSAMVDTTANGGTGTKCKFQKIKVPVAGKTGTAHDNVDLWFAGFTPYYCSAIWTGFDGNLSQTDTTYYRDLWRNVMEKVHIQKEKTDITEFARPNSIVKASICTKCGKLAVTGVCDQTIGRDGKISSCVKTEYFAKGTVPLQICDCHEKVTICTETGCRATEYCPHTKDVVYLIKEESETTLDHGGTWDTKTILPEDKDKDCPKHEDAPAPTPDPSGNDDPLLNP